MDTLLVRSLEILIPVLSGWRFPTSKLTQLLYLCGLPKDICMQRRWNTVEKALNGKKLEYRITDFNTVLIIREKNLKMLLARGSWIEFGKPSKLAKTYY
mmetsp:Transcript_12660/g.14540  ORF Transcript_12660/g.14540 Transcript_12660/m.14540 type:complete len:99 (+) Transcript_12660:223-519(+)